jgi:type I pantothenate kinase
VLALSEDHLASLSSLNNPVPLPEVEQVYLPFSRLLQLYVEAGEHQRATASTFLGSVSAKLPYVIGVVGGVAVGKSTSALLLQELISAWPSRPRVELVSTDAFLFPNRLLEKRGLENRKGFPETYDLPRLARFLTEVKSGKPELTIPIYSHLIYDILPDQAQVIRQPDILIVEGLNLLQVAGARFRKQPHLVVSDFLDMTIYIDAEEADIEQWFIERILLLRERAFHDPSSFYTRFIPLTVEETVQLARYVWQEINGPNLRKHILPTRERADLILYKSRDHSIQEVKLRKL